MQIPGTIRPAATYGPGPGITRERGGLVVMHTGGEEAPAVASSAAIDTRAALAAPRLDERTTARLKSRPDRTVVHQSNAGAGQRPGAHAGTAWANWANSSTSYPHRSGGHLLP